MQTVISLTSIPPRFGGLKPVLLSLLSQGADIVCLTVPHRYDRFAGSFELPDLPSGITVLHSDIDHGPATKLLPALRAFPKAQIAVCDDDCIYGAGWLDALLGSSQHGNAVTGQGWSVTRLKRRGALPPNTDVAQGFSGILTCADYFDEDIFHIPEPAWPVDDIWISAQLARRGISLLPCPAARQCVTTLDAPKGLQDERFGGHSRASLNEACASFVQARYGIWPTKDQS